MTTSSMKRTTTHRIEDDEIFVFGSNWGGIHGAGAALTAFDTYGAEWEKAQGLSGRSYAVPTKSKLLRPLPISEVRMNVASFLRFAETHPELKFFVTEIGTGYARIPHEVMAPMFAKRTSNVRISPRWERIIEEGRGLEVRSDIPYSEDAIGFIQQIASPVAEDEDEDEGAVGGIFLSDLADME